MGYAEQMEHVGVSRTLFPKIRSVPASIPPPPVEVGTIFALSASKTAMTVEAAN
jgi:hypothetical protein